MAKETQSRFIEHAGAETETRSKLNIQGPADVFALATATGLGAGLLPFVPGTFGSLVGVGIFYLLMIAFRFTPEILLTAVLLAGVATAFLGIWAAKRAEKIFGRKDAQQIVIDEVCGQLITFTFVAPYLVKIGGQWRLSLLIGFLLFRLFDIAKPYPLRQLEKLGSGLGVMADDIAAGIYAAIVLSLLFAFAH